MINILQSQIKTKSPAKSLYIIAKSSNFGKGKCLKYHPLKAPKFDIQSFCKRIFHISTQKFLANYSFEILV